MLSFSHPKILLIVFFWSYGILVTVVVVMGGQPGVEQRSHLMGLAVWLGIVGIPVVPTIAQEAAPLENWTEIQAEIQAEIQTEIQAEIRLEAQTPQTALCPADLEDAIEAITTREEFRRGHWGILVQTEDQQTLYAQNAERLFIPASNAKLLTSAAILETLGADFRIRTSVYQLGSQSGETVLRIAGRGDPSLTDQDLRDLAQQLRDRGITRIDLLMGDDSYFQGDATNPTWEWEDVQAGYGTPVNSLILNENAIGLTLTPQAVGQPLRVDWMDAAETAQWQVVNRSVTVDPEAPEFVRVGRDLNQNVLYVEGQLRAGAELERAWVSVPQPAQRFMQRFGEILAIQGIQVQQSLITNSPVTNGGAEIAAVESPPLAELLMEANQESVNLYAESLLRILGVQASASDPTWEDKTALAAGIEAVETVLTQLGVNSEGYALADGSGLSRRNLISPEATVQTLQAMIRSVHAPLYRSSLPVAGVSGTLQNRFQNTPIQGRLQAKTGALTNAIALSGYLEPINYPALVFSITVNQYNQPLGRVQQSMDEIVETLGQLTSCD
ncbi:D-alanyl-D-alanine carboxypeptidase/D-alanyl-D-alanine endopeptidase [Egbenema bharatensis]|uniref:D-alanyl-D-alanine carboxypeptidase/D-alanyl-D-alanine endopeptidase n=1 Tax=Egbenema bharatensis TaxID=3463334 RepID=UPI003A8BC541